MSGGASLQWMGGSVEPLQLGDYQLIRRLATGGMAELFLARPLIPGASQRPVVLKRILPQHAESDDFIRMFLTEARLAVNLRHPNIVRVHDIGEANGQYFFTMEYIQGQDLRRFVRRARKLQRPIPLDLIIHAVIGVAAGLHHAHDLLSPEGKPLGIVHRDVSPSNVLVTYDGDIKVVDFGIAKAATAQVATVAGTLKGKIPYMSPEQCRGEAVDRRSDIFTIGTLLWELTTGRRLFAGDNEFAILNRVAKGDVPSPSSMRADYPPDLEAIVMRALQADRTMRYATAHELELDLVKFARDARLPVSSSRMSAYLKELFPEEIRESRAEVELIEQGELPTLPFVGRSPRETQEYTPSGLRAGSSPTGRSVPGIEGSPTHVGSQPGSDSQIEVDVDADLPPRRHKAVGMWVAGSLMALSVSVWGVMASMDVSWRSIVPPREAPAQVEVHAGEPKPGGAMSASVPVQPDPPAVAEQPVVVVEPHKPKKQAGAEPEDAELDDVETILIEEDEPKPKPKVRAGSSSDKRASRTPSRRRSRASRQPERRRTASTPKKKPPARQPEPQSDAPAKPKWDPDAPLPPGF